MLAVDGCFCLVQLRHDVNRNAFPGENQDPSCIDPSVVLFFGIVNLALLLCGQIVAKSPLSTIWQG